MSDANKGPKQHRRKPTNAEAKAKRAGQQMARNRDANALKAMKAKRAEVNARKGE